MRNPQAALGFHGSRAGIAQSPRVLDLTREFPRFCGETAAGPRRPLFGVPPLSGEHP
jgi:hypothetical protein